MEKKLQKIWNVLLDNTWRYWSRVWKRNGEESSEIQDYETFMEEEKEYAELTHKGKLKIHEEPKFDETQYYTANTGNAVELDTYLTNPHNRSVGLARIILYNGIQNI